MISAEGCKIAVEVLHELGTNIERKENSWAVIFTKSEIKVLVKCLKFGQHANALAIYTTGKDIKFIKKIIKDLGRVA